MWNKTRNLVIALSMGTMLSGCSVQDLIDFLQQIDPPTPPPVEPCEEEYEQCLNAGLDEQLCSRSYDECLGIEPPPVDECEAQLEDCLNGGYGATTEPGNGGAPDIWYPGEDECYEMYADCVEPPPVDPCEEQLDECLENGDIYTDYGAPSDDAAFPVDPNDGCWEQYDECTGYEPPPPHPCDIELEECFEGQGQDDGSGHSEDPAVMPVPEDDCWIQYDECWNGGEPVEPPVDECEPQFYECLDSGVEPEACERALEDCYGYDTEPALDSAP